MSTGGAVVFAFVAFLLGAWVHWRVAAGILRKVAETTGRCLVCENPVARAACGFMGADENGLAAGCSLPRFHDGDHVFRGWLREKEL